MAEGRSGAAQTQIGQGVKPAELAHVFLRQANQQEPVEMVLSDGKDIKIIRLRPSQLKQLAYDAIRMALRI